MELLRLQRDKVGSGAYLEPVVARIRSMSQRFNSPVEGLINAVWDHYGKNSPYLGLWVAIEEKAIIGHAVALLETWEYQPVCWINQVEVDQPVHKQFNELFLEELETWVRLISRTLFKGQQINLLMQSPRMTDAWARHAGFEQHRMIFKREVK